MNVCLTIAGLDPSGGAGVIADIRTFSAFRCFGAAAVTSITFQNTTGVFGAVHQTPETVRLQIEPVFADFDVAAIKTGMLPGSDVIHETAELLRSWNKADLVVDPVVRSTSGFDLIDDHALAALVKDLFPLAIVVTPNLPEAERISGIRIGSADDVIKAAGIIRSKGAKNVLIKGGHFDGDNQSNDYLFVGGELSVIKGERINTTATHGTGCTLSSAIAANLALGNELADAVRIAKQFVTEAIRNGTGIGRGHGPVNQMFDRA